MTASSLPSLKQVAGGLAGRVLFEIDRFQQRHRRRVAVTRRGVRGALHPVHGREIDTVVVLQHAALKDGRRHRVERHADALAREIRRRAHGFPVDGDHAVPEHARRKDRQRDKRILLRVITADEFRERHLGEIEAFAAGHAVEDLARLIDHNVVEIGAVDGNFAGHERQGAVVRAAGERQGSFQGHDS